MLGNPDKVTAVKALGRGYLAPFGIDIAHILVMRTDGKAFGEDLVPDSGSDPIGYRHHVAGELRAALKIVEIRKAVVKGIGEPFLGEIAHTAIRTAQLKDIGKAYIGARHGCVEIFKFGIAEANFHLRFITAEIPFILIAEVNKLRTEYGKALRTETDMHLPVQGANIERTRGV